MAPEPSPPSGPGTSPGGPGLRALVVDDELPALTELAWLLGRDARIGAVRTADNGADALRALDAEGADVVFCDIRMPGLDGLELARVLARFAERPQLVFVTAFEQHALDAFEVAATDYVLKPVREPRLAEAITKVSHNLSRTRTASPAPQPEDETIPVDLGGVTRFVRRSDVQYVRAHGDYARLHTATGTHLVRVPLSQLEERWASAGFVRIHRSTLVSLRAITEARLVGSRSVVSLGDIELQVSRRHSAELKQRLLRPLGESG